MKRVVIQIEQSSEGVYVATSQDLRGLAVESPDQEEIFALSREIAGEMLELEGEKDSVELDFEMIGSGA